MSEKSQSDIEILQEKICHYGEKNSSKKRKKHSSKKKKKKKRQKKNLDDSISLVDLVSDSDTDDTDPQYQIVSKTKGCDSNEISPNVKSVDNDNNLINCEATNSGRSVECNNVIENNIDKNESAIKINQTIQLGSQEQNINTKDFEKYFGNISEIDFGDMEIDTVVSQEPLILSDSQRASFETDFEFTDKEKNVLKKGCDLKKFWPTYFDVEEHCLTKTNELNIKTLPKKVVQDKKSAMITSWHNKSSEKNIDTENKSTLIESTLKTNFSCMKESEESINVLKTNLPLTIDANGNKVFRFFWWDAYEAYKPPGVVYLFGKVHIEKTNNFKSCCVAVRNIPRRIYLLPRKFILRTESEHNELNTYKHVYNEVNEYMNKIKVNEFKFKEVTKMYCFDKKDVPKSATYYEVRYSALYPAIDPNYSSPTIQAVFETSMSPLELFLIEKKIKGPCWLDLKTFPKEPNKTSSDYLYSWCKIEANCLKMEDISVTKYQNKSVPSVVLAALYIQVSLDYQLDTKEIINIVVLLNHKFQLNKPPVKAAFDQSYCLVTHPQKVDWPNNASEMLTKSKQSKVICCKDELELLEKLLEILEQSDPDILVSYDSKFQLEVLVHQIITLKVKDWSRIGKLKCFQPPYFKDRIYLDQLFCGRPFCDLQTSVKELNVKTTNNDLLSLCSVVLHKEINKCKDIKPEDCPSYYESIEKLESLVRSTMIKALYVLEIALELNALQLAVEQTRIAGNTLSRTLAAGVSERNEYLLLHAFHSNGYIIPEKRKGKSDPHKKAAFSGGTILEPVRGFYDSLILVMDYNSLYPSIIMEFNICFSTIPGAAYEEFIQLYSRDINLRLGIIPTEMQILKERRDQVKKLMQSQLSEESKFQNNVKQLALKLTANSVYGCLGAPYSRFYSKALAALIAMKGRELFHKTVSIVESLGYKVIYGDTDSIMIRTKYEKYEDAIGLGKYIKQTVNKSYKKIELNIDAVFKYFLLLMKKQYAAISITQLPTGSLKFTKEIKGLEIIKRNYCSLACNTGNQILDQILNDQQREQRTNKILEILRTVKQNLEGGILPLTSLEIAKQLSKDPSKYHSSQVSSHAVVAQRLNKNNVRKWQAGDIITYVVCKDATDRNAGERAYHVSEITANPTLKIDVDYYLSSQIYPVVSKICSPIEGIGTELIAETLGVKKSKSLTNSENSGTKTVCKNRFEDCIPFEYYCQNENCKTLNQVNTVLVESPTGFQPSLATCSNSKCDQPPFKYAHYIQNKLQLDIRKYITQYYKSEFKCDSELCLNICESVTLDTSSKFLKCHKCFDGNLHKIYKESDLFNQICFFLFIFTLKENHLDRINQNTSDDLLHFYNKISEFILDELDNSAYNVVDLTKLFNQGTKEANSKSRDKTVDLADDFIHQND